MKITRFLRNSFGMGLLEVLVAVGLTGALSLTIAKLMQNSTEESKVIAAKSQNTSLKGSVESVLGNAVACYNTFNILITPANMATLNTAGGTVAVPFIKNKNNTSVYGPLMTNTDPIVIQTMTLGNYIALDDTADLVINSNFRKSAKITMAPKPITIKISLDVSPTNTLTSCLSLSGGGNVGQWQDMSSPLVGIFYNMGSVLVGSGTVDTGNANYPAFGMGSTNTVSGHYATGLGNSNSIDFNSVSAFAAGSTNVITNSAYSAAIGQANTVNISLGSFGGSGPMAAIGIGRANNVRASESVGLGYGNTVDQRFGVAIGTSNRVTGSAGTAIGSWNYATGTDTIAIGQYAEANGNNSTALGQRVKSNGDGSMTLGDKSSAGTYLVNGNPNAFASRFAGGYSFFANSANSPSLGAFLDPTGFFGLGTDAPAYKLDVGIGGARYKVGYGNPGVAISATYGNVVIPPVFAPDGGSDSTEILRLGGALRMAGFYTAGSKTGTIFFGNSPASDGNLTYWEGAGTGYFTLNTVKGGFVMSNEGNIGIGQWPSYGLDINPTVASGGLTTAGKPGGGSWTNSSDRRLKKEIKNFSGALEKINKLRAVQFEWINPELHPGPKVDYGFIAQEMEKVFPEWVSEHESRNDDALLIPKGEKIKDLTFPFSFNAYIVKAVQELNAQVIKNLAMSKIMQEGLSESISKLEKRVIDLESENKIFKTQLINQQKAQQEMKIMLCSLKQNVNSGFCKK